MQESAHSVHFPGVFMLSKAHIGALHEICFVTRLHKHAIYATRFLFKGATAKKHECSKNKSSSQLVMLVQAYKELTW